jgi:YbgC/YbaW family acyl-CoA thioester hydrolase
MSTSATPNTLREPESVHLVRFADCDPYMHLNNSRYLDYFISAREDHLRIQHGFNIYEFVNKTGLGWVVSKSQIVYLRPALLMETIIIQSAVLNFGEKDVTVEMKMFNKEKTHLKSLLWTVFSHFNIKTGKSEIHSEELISRFKPLELFPEVTTQFDERVRSLKSLFNSKIN